MSYHQGTRSFNFVLQIIKENNDSEDAAEDETSAQTSVSGGVSSI